MSIFFCFTCLVTFNIVNFSFFNSEKHTVEISHFTKLSLLPGIVKSVSYFEPRFAEYEDVSTHFFTDIEAINYMKFTYE